jgi:hypothetical protein
MTPPIITVAASPATLWPPNRQLVSVTVSGTITDEPGGSGVNATSAAYVVLDEYGQMQPSGSFTLEADGGYFFTVALQASRRGNDQDGRHYTIKVGATDNAGNLGSASTIVTVPHNKPRHPLADSCHGTTYFSAPLSSLLSGCLRLLRGIDTGDHLRALIRLLMVSVLTPPHQSPFGIKASGAAPERGSLPCPWRTAPQQSVGTLPCPCGLQVMRSYTWHCPTRSRLPDGASGRTAGMTLTSSQLRGLPCLGATRARAHGRGGGVTHLASTPQMEVRMGVWLSRTPG